MAENSKIEWTTHTANLWWGCTEVHEGCDNCYARVLSHRWGQELWGNDVPRKMIKNTFSDLAKYQKLAKALGEVHRVFVGSMMDIFERQKRMIDSTGMLMPEEFNTGTLRDVLFKRISDGEYPNLIFLLLTKRPSNINRMIPVEWLTNGAPANVMFGTSPVNQETANKLIPQLLAVKGKRFLSIEPQLDQINLLTSDDFSDNGHGARWLGVAGNAAKTDGIHWIINGGESGAKRRPFNLDWGRALRDTCAGAGVPFFFKQVDKVLPIPEDLLIRELPAYFSGENILL